MIQKGLDLEVDSKFRKCNEELLRSLNPEFAATGLQRDKASFISPVGHWLRLSYEIIKIDFESYHDAAIFKIKELNGRQRGQFSGKFHKTENFGYWLSLAMGFECLVLPRSALREFTIAQLDLYILVLQSISMKDCRSLIESSKEQAWIT